VRPRAFRWIGSNVLVPAGIAVVLLGLLEGACRIVGRARTGSWPVTTQESATRFTRRVGQAYQTHPFLSVAARPGARIEVPGHVAVFNSLGTRGPEVEVPKPAGRFRVVCEGGSTTFDLLASDDAAAWPARLGAILGPGADVVNAGFPGWTTVQGLVALELRDVDLGPDLVVLFSGVNDLQPAGHVPFARDYAYGHGEILPRVLGATEPPLPLVARSLVVEWLRGRLGRPAASVDARGYAPAWKWSGGARRDRVPEEAVAVFARNLRSASAVARSCGARTLLVAQSARLRKGSEAADRAFLESWTPGLTAEGFLDGIARYNAAARELGAAGIAEFVDPFEGSGFSDDDFGDPFHFSDAGSRKFAARLAVVVERLREEGRAQAAANIRGLAGPAAAPHGR
jgi:lysophospholipase L1-like esterase